MKQFNWPYRTCNKIVCPKTSDKLVDYDNSVSPVRTSNIHGEARDVLGVHSIWRWGHRRPRQWDSPTTMGCGGQTCPPLSRRSEGGASAPHGFSERVSPLQGHGLLTVLRVSRQGLGECWQCCGKGWVSAGSIATGAEWVLAVLRQELGECWQCCGRSWVSAGSVAAGAEWRQGLGECWQKLGDGKGWVSAGRNCMTARAGWVLAGTVWRQGLGECWLCYCTFFDSCKIKTFVLFG